jgi:hypothetical protein
VLGVALGDDGQPPTLGQVAAAGVVVSDDQPGNGVAGVQAGGQISERRDHAGVLGPLGVHQVTEDQQAGGVGRFHQGQQGGTVGPGSVHGGVLAQGQAPGSEGRGLAEVHVGDHDGASRRPPHRPLGQQFKPLAAEVHLNRGHGTSPCGGRGGAGTPGRTRWCAG